MILKNTPLWSRLIRPGIFLTAGLAPVLLAAETTTVRVTIENLAPEQGTILTPFWLGFHDGGFDLFNTGEAASAGIEAMAEDGNLAPLRDAFATSGAGSIDGVLTGLGMQGTPPLFFPGQTNSWTITLENDNAANAFFSYASMILPSNDAFVGNGNPQGYPVFDEAGNFMRQEFIVLGSAVWDAGTEVNDELAENVPVLGQMAPNTGTTENGTVALHPGFIEGGNVLTNFPNAQFTTAGYEVARIIIEEVPTEYVNVRVTIENLAPDQGTILTPFWLGFHDGSFDLFNTGEAASAGIEAMAEDGNLAPLRDAFAASGTGSLDGVLTDLGMDGTPPLFFPSQTNSWTVSLDRNDLRNAFFSYASMILPSNDAFVGNGNPQGYPIFDGNGDFVPQEFIILGSSVWDAGTEVNDELAENVPVLGQMAPNTGTTEDGTVALHPGFIEGGNVLTNFPNAQFTVAGYEVARIIIEEIPVRPVTLDVTITSLAPDQGTILTPFWLGFHDGSLDLYNPGEAASAGIEAMAEDGNLAPLRDLFAESGVGTVDGVLTGLGMEGTPPLFFPGQSNTWTVTVDANDAQNRFLSFASMILPSNDAFVANNNPEAFVVIDEAGAVIGLDRTISGRAVWDAGTEVNDELAENVPVLGQMAPNTGVTENGVVTRHPGFLAEGNVLTAFPNAQFTANGYELFQLTVTERINPFADYPADETGIKDVSGFGRTFDGEYPFLWNEDHGWFYVNTPLSATQFWAYNFLDDLGWIYINLDHYPYVYHAQLGWLFYDVGSRNPRRFYDLANEVWITVP